MLGCAVMHLCMLLLLCLLSLEQVKSLVAKHSKTLSIRVCVCSSRRPVGPSFVQVGAQSVYFCNSESTEFLNSYRSWARKRAISQNVPTNEIGTWKRSNTVVQKLPSTLENVVSRAT